MPVRRERPTLDLPAEKHGLTCHRLGCGCDVGRTANRVAQQEWRDRQRAKAGLAAKPRHGLRSVPDAPVVTAAAAPNQGARDAEATWIPGPVEAAVLSDLEALPAGAVFGAVKRAMALRLARVMDSERHDLAAGAVPKLEALLGSLAPKASGGDAPAAKTPKELMYESLSAGPTLQAKVGNTA